MSESQPAKTTTKASAPDEAVEAKDAKLAPPREVTYLFTFFDRSYDGRRKALVEKPRSVRLRFAHQISAKGSFDGAASLPKAGRPLPAVGKAADTTFTVPAGERIRLFLNSDALAGFRQEPVYEVKPDGRDVEVRISEKFGTLAPGDASLAGPTTEKRKDGREIDVYTGTLSGLLWMRVTHRFTAAEVAEMIPGVTPEPIRTAVLSAYSGPRERALVAEWPEEGSEPEMTPVDVGDAQTPVVESGTCRPAQTIRVDFQSGVDGNARENIAGFDFLADGLPRVHPNTLIAIFNAAYESGVTEMTVSSAWRPMLGSIAHRSGLGLDLKSIGDGTTSAVMDRKQFANAEAAAKRFEEAKARIPPAEARVAKARSGVTTAGTKFDAARSEVTRIESQDPGPEATPAVRTSHDRQLQAAKRAVTTSETARTKAERELRDAESALAAANSGAKTAEHDLAEAQRARDAELERPSESPLVQRFRAALADQKGLVAQLFEPWRMDGNTRDAVPSTANDYTDDNERLHINHLHVTACEPTLL